MAGGRGRREQGNHQQASEGEPVDLLVIVPVAFKSIVGSGGGGGGSGCCCCYFINRARVWRISNPYIVEVSLEVDASCYHHLGGRGGGGNFALAFVNAQKNAM